MADDRTLKGEQDRSHISLSEDYESATGARNSGSRPRN
jgi:hypothetical protein